MPTRPTLPVLLTGLLAGLLTAAHPAAANDTLRPRLEQANAALALAWQTEDVPALLARYDAAAMLMPEHALARQGGEAIADYHRQWFALTDTGSFARRIHEVLDYGDHAIETGTFRHAYTLDGGSPHDYIGKYMVLWNTAGPAPRVVAELWGADAAFDDALLPAIVDGEPVNLSALPGNDAGIAYAIGNRNALIRQLVMERKGAEHAQLFVPDAIYMTYYTPMLVGIEAIRPYFLEHERPGPVALDALDLRTGRIHPLDGGRLQLEEGFYRVAWRAGADRGTVEGKSLNLWQRDPDGSWMLYRQAVNHD